MAGWGTRKDGGRPFPASRLAGGEGEVGGNEEEIEPHPLVLVARREMVGGGGSTEEGGRWRRRLVGGATPVGIGRREVVGKVHEGEAELLVGLAWAELLWNGESTAA